MIESEKLLEKNLRQLVSALGGWALKIPAIHHAGVPDRICLFPGGRILFVEVKTTKKTPTKLQLLTHRKLRDMGFRVEVVDTGEQIRKLIGEYAD